MTRILTLAYGTVSYASFVLTFLYAIGFLGNFGVSKSLDSGATDPWPTALAITWGCYRSSRFSTASWRVRGSNAC